MYGVRQGWRQQTCNLYGGRCGRRNDREMVFFLLAIGCPSTIDGEGGFHMLDRSQLAFVADDVLAGCGSREWLVASVNLDVRKF